MGKAIDMNMEWAQKVVASLLVHQADLNAEIDRLKGADPQFPPRCHINVGVGLGGYIRTMDDKSPTLLPVRQRITLAEAELQETERCIEHITPHTRREKKAKKAKK